MTPGLVADTHALVWYLSRDERLSSRALLALRETVSAGGTLFVSAVSLVEILYLVEKGRLPGETLLRAYEAVTEPGGPIIALPVDLSVCRAMEAIPRDAVPDMPDRIIAATALSMRLPLVTRDGRIRASGLETVW